MIEIKRMTTGEVLMRLDVETLAGANFHDQNLRGADLSASDLSGADLSGAAMRGADLSEATIAEANMAGANLLLANLTRANLADARMCNAVLEGALLRRANLRGADLTAANLFGAVIQGAFYDERTRWPAGFDPAARGARMAAPGEEPPEDRATKPCPHCQKEIFFDARKCRHCGQWINRGVERDTHQGLRIYDSVGKLKSNLKVDTLQGVDLRNVDLRGANLVNVNFRSAKLGGVDLTKAGMHGANLEGADLADAVLNGANLREANAAGASMSGATMKGVCLESACLNGADLSRTNLREANMMEADARGADFVDAILHGANMIGLQHDGSTRWPPGFDPTKQGAPTLSKPAAPVSRVAEAEHTPAPSAKIKCPFCAEAILADARKCRYCGEWLEEPGATPMAAPAPVELPAAGAMTMFAAVGAGLLVILILVAGYMLLNPGGPPVAKGAPKGVALTFPETSSFGTVEVRDWSATETVGGWNSFGLASGKLTIPAAKQVKLTVTASPADLTPLGKLKPNALHSLDLMLAGIEDADLDRVKNLQGLRELYLPNTVTDAAIPKIVALKGLTTLVLADAKVTENGVEPLKELKGLVYLQLPKTIGNKAVADLKAALPTCDIQR